MNAYDNASPKSFQRTFLLHILIMRSCIIVVVIKLSTQEGDKEYFLNNDYQIVTLSR